jgi:hypothetical protein
VAAQAHVWRIVFDFGATRAIGTIKRQLADAGEKADLCWN